MPHAPPFNQEDRERRNLAERVLLSIGKAAMRDEERQMWVLTDVSIAFHSHDPKVHQAIINLLKGN